MATQSFLDYEGLKSLVRCIMEEMPKADGTTIVANEDGTFSALPNATVDTSSNTLVISSSNAK